MSALNFVPEIWAKVILAAVKKNLVFAGPGVANNDYEGEISGPGDTVHITSFSDPAVSDYVQNTPITWTRPSDSDTVLNIDQQKYATFTVEDIDRRQAAGDFQDYLEGRMSYVLAEAEDRYVAGLYTAVDAGNIIKNGSNSSVTAGNGINTGFTPGTASTTFYDDVVLPLNVKLDDAQVPDDGNRYLVVPPFAHAMLRRTPAFVNFGYDDVLLKGQLGTVDGFTVYKSQNAVKFDSTAGGTAPNTYSAGYVVMAGHPFALTVAEQISTVEALRLQSQFADGVRALHVYGAKVTRPTGIAVAGVDRPTSL